MQASDVCFCLLLQLVILHWLYSSLALAVNGQLTVLAWPLNRTVTIDTSSSGVAFSDERHRLSLYPFPTSDSFGDGDFISSPNVVFPCFVAANDSRLHLLSSAIFALCMRPQPTYSFSSIDSPFQNASILWAANRDSPAQGESLSLTLKDDGDLVFYGDGIIERPVWRSGTEGKGVVGMELTENPANLKLLDSKNNTVWQSMDYPFDTLSFGQSLQVGMKLVSWASGGDFSEGQFSLVVEPGLQLRLLYTIDNDDKSPVIGLPYWIWHPNSNAVPAACQDLDFDNMTLVSCLDRIGFANTSQYFSTFLSSDGFSAGLIYNGTSHLQTVLSFTMTDNTLQTSILKLDYDGGLRIYSIESGTWVILADLFDRDICLLPTRCGTYGLCTSNGQCTCPDIDADMGASASFVSIDASDPSQGCRLARPFPFNCLATANQSASSSLQMLPIKGGVDYFANQYHDSTAVELPRNIGNGTPYATDGAWSALCLHNCSCLAAFWHTESMACFHVQRQIGSFRGALNVSKYKAYVKLSVSLPAPSPVTPHEGSFDSLDSFSRHLMPVAVPVGVVIGLGGCILLGIFLYRKGYIRHKFWNRLENADVFAEADMLSDLPTRFSFKELDTATNYFSQTLGKGGFGTVYLGTLSNGSRVAVKRLEGFRQGDKEFRSELKTMAGVHHYNLLQLMGFCAEEEKRLLVYKYMENGSLDQWLFGRSSLSDGAADRNAARLSWEVRFNVAIGVARGLAYLHEGCRKHILHLDIKPQNILLDVDFVAKVADFGLSRPMERNESHVVTTMRGTPGYLAPEWLKGGGTVGVKCDVFSYGMLLMEIVSGRKNMDEQLGMTYPEWAFSQLAEKKSNTSSNGNLLMEAEEHWSDDGLTDAKLCSKEDRVQLERFVITAFMCVLEKPEWRPSMSMVVQMLEGHVSVADIDISSLRPGLTFVLGNDSSCTNFADLRRRLDDFFASSGVLTSIVDHSSVHVSAR